MSLLGRLGQGKMRRNGLMGVGLYLGVMKKSFGTWLK